MYFIKITEDSLGKRRYQPLPFQFIDNIEVQPSKIVMSSQAKLQAYPKGTVFAVCQMVAIGQNYAAGGEIYPVTTKAIGINDKDIDATGDMMTEWNKFLQAHPNYTADDTGTEMDLFSQQPDPVKTPKVNSAAPARNLLSTLLHKYPMPTIDKDGFYVSADNWSLLVRNVHQRENTLIYGCQGLGKTELVLLLGERMGKPVKVYDMGSMHDPMSQMLGTHRLVSDGVNTVSKFDPARFTQDIQEDCIILLDELNRAPSTTLNILFPCLDSRRMLPVEMAGGAEARNIQVHPQCCFIATSNIGSRHVGTLPLDPALYSRFLPLELTHMDIGDEMALLRKRCGVNSSEAGAICKVAQMTREKVKLSELSIEISPRETLRAAGLIRDGFSLLKSMEMTFLPMYQNDERDIVKTMFVTR